MYIFVWYVGRRRPSFFRRAFRLGGERGVSVGTLPRMSISAELRGACSEHLKSPSWLYIQGGEVRLAEPSGCCGKPHHYNIYSGVYFLITRSALAFFNSLRSPARCTTPSVQTCFHLSYPLRRNSNSSSSSNPL